MLYITYRVDYSQLNIPGVNVSKQLKGSTWTRVGLSEQQERERFHLKVNKYFIFYRARFSFDVERMNLLKYFWENWYFSPSILQNVY